LALLQPPTPNTLKIVYCGGPTCLAVLKNELNIMNSHVHGRAAAANHSAVPQPTPRVSNLISSKLQEHIWNILKVSNTLKDMPRLHVKCSDLTLSKYGRIRCCSYKYSIIINTHLLTFFRWFIYFIIYCWNGVSIGTC
jgi:hypothetical protein